MHTLRVDICCSCSLFIEYALIFSPFINIEIVNFKIIKLKKKYYTIYIIYHIIIIRGYFFRGFFLGGGSKIVWLFFLDIHTQYTHTYT